MKNTFDELSKEFGISAEKLIKYSAELAEKMTAMPDINDPNAIELFKKRSIVNQIALLEKRNNDYGQMHGASDIVRLNSLAIAELVKTL